jgi:coenzyme PQQ precursor peptide PqqA
VGADEGNQRAKGEKVAAQVPRVEKRDAIPAREVRRSLQGSQNLASEYLIPAQRLASGRKFFLVFRGSLIDFGRALGYATSTFAGLAALRFPGGYIVMQWTAPAFEEVCLNCEINSYASAKL